MDYFPPNGLKGNWQHLHSSATHRRGSYKGYFMSVAPHGEKWTGRYWTWVRTGPFYFQQKCLSAKRGNFKTEKDAAEWCENAVEHIDFMKVVQEVKDKISSSGYDLEKIKAHLC